MPQFSVNSDLTASTAQATTGQVAALQDKLHEVKNSINSLLTDGFQTPAAQQKFSPFVDQFTKDFAQINDTLTQIGQFVRSVGEAYEKTDEQVGGIF